MRTIFVALAFLLTLGAVQGQERCDPVVPPAPAPKADPGTPAPARKAPEFWVIKGGTSGPQIAMLGDSLTTPYFGKTVSALLGDRQYEIYAIGGLSAEILSDLFDKQRVPAETIGIIWIGRNSEATEVDLVLGSLARAVARFDSGKYLILNVLTGSAAPDQPGGARRVAIDALNEAIAATYGDRVIAVRPLVACSDFEDTIHLHKPGQDKIAHAVADAIRARGW